MNEDVIQSILLVLLVGRKRDDYARARASQVDRLIACFDWKKEVAGMIVDQITQDLVAEVAQRSQPIGIK